MAKITSLLLVFLLTLSPIFAEFASADPVTEIVDPITEIVDPQRQTTDFWATKEECLAATTAQYYVPQKLNPRPLGPNEKVSGILSPTCFKMVLPDRMISGGVGWVKIGPDRKVVYDIATGKAKRLEECGNEIFDEALIVLPTTREQLLGPKGDPGPQGPQGIQGPQGFPGTPGQPGRDAQNGPITFTANPIINVKEGGGSKCGTWCKILIAGIGGGVTAAVILTRNRQGGGNTNVTVINSIPVPVPAPAPTTTAGPIGVPTGATNGPGPTGSPGTGTGPTGGTSTGPSGPSNLPTNTGG